MRKIFYAILASVAILMVLAGCSGKEQASAGKLQVSAGIGPVAAIVETIGGDSVTVECLLPSGADPEEFDPGTRALRSLSNSDIYFVTGTLPFEQSLAASVSESGSGIRIVDLSEGIELIYGTHGDEPDPHMWMSLRNLQLMARAVTAQLIEARPAAAGYFNGRLEEYEKTLVATDSLLTARLAPLAGSAFAVGHPSMSYMARDYDLRQLPLAHGTKEGSAKGLRERLDSVRAARPLIFFAEPGTESDMARETAQQLGIPSATVDPMSPDVKAQIVEAACNIAKTRP